MQRNAVRFMLRAALFVVLIIGLIAGVAWWWHAKIMHATGPHTDDRIVLVMPGDGHATIRWTLKRAGVISELYGYDAARLMAGDKFVPKAGEYNIPAGEPLAGVLKILHQGRSMQRRLTVIEGLRSLQIQQQLNDVEHLKGAVDAPPAEGSILPETYFYTHGTTRAALIQRMQENRDMVLLDYWVNRKADLPYQTPEDAVIMASIIERESRNSAERKLVAGVFVNRLQRGMRLQSDPTVLYGVSSSPDGPISKADLKRDTPWNTYRIKGLPKTPICNPGRDAIDAALNPAETEFLYFVSDAKGGLLFAKTLDAHNKNVRLFRKRVRAKKAAQTAQ